MVGAGKPVAVAVAVSLSPIRACPEMPTEVTRGGAWTGDVGSDRRVSTPLEFVAVALTAKGLPTSAPTTSYEAPVAPSIGLQASESPEQRSHWNRTVGGGLPDVVADAVSVLPSSGSPAIATELTLAGSDGVTTAVSGDRFESPPDFTRTASGRPTSASVTT